MLLLTSLGLCFTVRNEAGSSRIDSEELGPTVALKNDEQLPVQSAKKAAAVKVKRDAANDESSKCPDDMRSSVLLASF